MIIIWNSQARFFKIEQSVYKKVQVKTSWIPQLACTHHLLEFLKDDQESLLVIVSPKMTVSQSVINSAELAGELIKCFKSAVH